MSNQIKEVEINGRIYIPKEDMQNIEGDIRIVVLQRGWVYIGRFTREENNICKLKNAYNIQRWGTTNGLGELVNGPTLNTVLKKCDGVIEFDWLTVIHTICVNGDKYPNI